MTNLLDNVLSQITDDSGSASEMDSKSLKSWLISLINSLDKAFLLFKLMPSDTLLLKDFELCISYLKRWGKKRYI